MPSNTINAVKGRRAELLCAAMLEEAGFPTCDISHRDFGLDLSLYVPAVPLARGEVRNLQEGGEYSGEITANFIHAQIKATEEWRISRSHLDQWASAIDRGTVIILVFCCQNVYTVFPPSGIVQARDYCLRSETGSANMTSFADDAVEIPTRSIHHLGLFLWGVSQCPTICIDLDAIYKVRDWQTFTAFINSHSELITDLIFRRHPAGRALNHAMDSDSEGLIGEVEGIVESLWCEFDIRCVGVDDKIRSLAEGLVMDISSEYQSDKYVQHQLTDDHFRERPPVRLDEDFKSMLKLIRQATV